MKEKYSRKTETAYTTQNEKLEPPSEDCDKKDGTVKCLPFEKSGILFIDDQ
jgi:hypothetical protein